MFQYKCTWPKCKFVSNSRSNAWRHIKNMHLTTGVKRNSAEFISKKELTENPINKKIEMAKKCVKNEVVNGTARECVCDECVFVFLCEQSENVQPTSNDGQLINQDLDYVNDCPTPDYLPPFFSEDEEEEDENDDENDEVIHSNSRLSARIVNKPKMTYQEEYFENQSESDYEPSDDGEGGGDVDEDTEVESDAETLLYNSISKPKPNKKSKQSHSKNNRPSVNNSKENDDHVHQSARKLEILTLQLNCSVCDKSFKHFYMLYEHLKNRHNILKYRCFVNGCSASFSNQTYAMRHQQSVHSDCINNWSCGQCHSKKFKSYQSLSKHVWVEHQTGRFRCAYEGCQFESNTKRSIVINHIRWEHLKNKFACKVDGCGMAFYSKEKLNRHSNVHTGAKPHKCEHCEVRYACGTNLKLHLAKVHDVGKLNQFKCEWPNCKYVAYTRGQTFGHIRRIHFKNDKQRDPREFISQTESTKDVHAKDKFNKIIIIRLNCPVDDCTDHFPDKNQLTNHLAKCHQIEQFRCMTRGCLRSFSNKCQFSSHIRNDHKSLQLWHCAKCEFKSKTYFTLSNHMYTCHEEGLFGCGHSGCTFVTNINRNEVLTHLYNHTTRKRDRKKSTLIITLRLNCPVDDCAEYFPDKNALTDHLLNYHRIHQCQCLLRGCFASFTKCSQLTAHQNEAHKNLNVWHCTKCDYQGKTHKLLSIHTRNGHEEGHFACGYSGCHFVSHSNRLELLRHQFKHPNGK